MMISTSSAVSIYNYDDCGGCDDLNDNMYLKMIKLKREINDDSDLIGSLAIGVSQA